MQRLPFDAYASQLTYGLLLAIFPAILVILTILGFFYNAADIYQQVFTSLEGIIPGQVLFLIRENLDEIWAPGSIGVFSIGFLLLVYTVQSLMRKIMSILNDVYGVKGKRSFWRRIALSGLLLLGGAVLIVLIVQLLFVTEGFINLIETLFKTEFFDINFLFWRWPLVLLVVFGFVYLSYVVIPNLKEHYWKFQVPGAIFYTVGWLIMSLIFNWYVSNIADYNKTYGLLGTIILMLFYINLNSYLYILGGVINSRIIKLREDNSFWIAVKKVFS